ncbi:MAG: glycoside hydrolase family 17 [Lasallia pustulata]|uniref:Probable glucan endo-1,3-beta-glucosidase eglC n=1 Tax=Lasallia pustulata TaxID=136370 RepID=A0A5M8PL42_9LECA|nr:MAG: glycoside hydrolase family 17 [Lasallia pustulata]
MKLLSLSLSHALALLTTISPTTAYWKGFSVGANNLDGSCKSQADWTRDFQTLQSLPGYFSSVRLFASSDCATLANAIPAALATNTKLLVGVWTEDSTHFAAETAALQSAILQYGSAWIISVSVGSEDLYRYDTTAAVLAAQINQTRSMLQSLGANVPVGHTDTWTAWVNASNAAVISACDFVGHTGYPYFQDAAIADAAAVFWDSVQAVQQVVETVRPGTWVWVMETGWPLSGATLGNAVPSVGNAQTYWKTVGCDAYSKGHVFMYTLQDANSSPSFGVVDANFNPIIDVSC